MCSQLFSPTDIVRNCDSLLAALLNCYKYSYAQSILVLQQHCVIAAWGMIIKCKLNKVTVSVPRGVPAESGGHTLLACQCFACT